VRSGRSVCVRAARDSPNRWSGAFRRCSGLARVMYATPVTAIGVSQHLAARHGQRDCYQRIRERALVRAWPAAGGRGSRGSCEAAVHGSGLSVAVRWIHGPYFGTFLEARRGGMAAAAHRDKCEQHSSPVKSLVRRLQDRVIRNRIFNYVAGPREARQRPVDHRGKKQSRTRSL
jgi:hypothetical protein